jgi:hypothetical protein
VTQLKVNMKLPFQIKVLDQFGAEVTLDEAPLITLSDDTPGVVTDDGAGGFFFIPADDAVGKVVELRAKVGEGESAIFGSVTIEVVAADVVVDPPVPSVVTFLLGEPVPK